MRSTTSENLLSTNVLSEYFLAEQTMYTLSSYFLTLDPALVLCVTRAMVTYPPVSDDGCTKSLWNGVTAVSGLLKSLVTSTKDSKNVRN